MSALGLCILAMFMLNGAEAGTLNAGSAFPDDERVNSNEEMTFKINVTFVDASETLDELVVYFANGHEVALDTICDEFCNDDPGDDYIGGIYTTNPLQVNAGQTVDNPGSETIEYGFKAKFQSNEDWHEFWPAEDAYTDSGIRVNTLPEMDPDAAVSPSPGMPYDTFTVTVTYRDADNHDGIISATVCETNLLENCQASFNLDKGVGENSDGVVYSKTFTTAFGGDDITVSLNATDDHDFALLNRTATFEIDTDRPWLVSDSVSTSTAGAGENVTISVVYCIFDDADDDAVSVNVGGNPYDLVGGDPSGDCINGKIFNITTAIDWALGPQTINFTASNENETSVLQPDGKEYLLSSSTITINDAPTLTAGTTFKDDGDNFIINVTAEDVNIDGDIADAITVEATIQYGGTYAMSLDEATGNYTVTVAQADIIGERGGSRIITFEATDLHLESTTEDFGNAVTIDVDTTSAFTLTASTTAATLTPGVHTVSFNIENNGNHEDRFTISVDSVNGWITSSPSEPVLVGYDSDEDFTITVTVPEVAAGTIDSWTVSAVAENVNTETGSEAGTTTVGAVSGREVSIGTSSSDADPGATVTYYFTVTNTGNAAESFAYTTNGNPASDNTGVLGMGESEVVAVSHTVPGGASAGAQFTLTFTSGAKSASATTTTNQVYDLAISLASTDENVGAVKPGDSITLTFTVENDGNGADTVSASFFGDWISGDADSNQAIASGASANFDVTVVVPASAASGSSSAVNAAVTGAGDSSDDTSYTISVAAGARGVSIAGTDTYTFNKGTSGSGTVTVTNTGVAATFAVVSMSPSLGFEVSEITLAGGASGDMTFTINADATGSAEFRIEDAIDNSFATFTLTINAREFSTNMNSWGLEKCSDTGVVCTYDLEGWDGVSYSKAGTWTTTLVYTDSNGQSGTHSFDTLVANKAPTLGAAPKLSATQGTEQSFTFTIPTDSDGSISHFVIDFGDGESATFQGSDLKGTTVTAKHTYSEEWGGQDVTVTATAYDNSGESTVQEITMTVNDRTVALEGSSYVYNLVALFGFFILGILLAGTAFKMQKGVIAGDEEMNERDRQRLESVERRMESLSEREELLEVSAYDASRAATKLEEHISAFNQILVQAQEIAAKEKLEELEAAEKAKKDADEQEQMDLEDPDIEMVAERFHSALGRLVNARDELSKIEEQLAHILKMERDEQLEKLTEMTESYETTKRKIDALQSSAEARDAAAVENNIMNLLSAAASGGSVGGADFGDFGDIGSDDEEYEVEIYEDEDGSFYYIDPDTGEEVPCDEDGNAL